MLLGMKSVQAAADVHVGWVNDLIIFVIRTQFFIFKTVLRIFKVGSPNEQVIFYLILSGPVQVLPS